MTLYASVRRQFLVTLLALSAVGIVKSEAKQIFEKVINDGNSSTLSRLHNQTQVYRDNKKLVDVESSQRMLPNKVRKAKTIKKKRQSIDDELGASNLNRIEGDDGITVGQVDALVSDKLRPRKRDKRNHRDDDLPVKKSGDRNHDSFKNKKVARSIPKLKIKSMSDALIGIKQYSNQIVNRRKRRSFVGNHSYAESLQVEASMSKASQKDDLLIDSSLSFVHAMLHGVVGSHGKGLNREQLLAFENWLLLVRISLPQEWPVNKVIDNVLSNIDQVSRDFSFIEKSLSKHPLPKTRWSESCESAKAPDAAFLCGFWKLLHVMSVGLAKHRGGNELLLDKWWMRHAMFSPGEAADVMREYIAHFFPCRKCSEAFLKRYDDCSYKRCERLTDEIDGASDIEWKEFAIYVWELHNDISIRILREQTYETDKIRKRSMSIVHGLTTTEEEARALWPSVGVCITCYHNDGTPDKNAIFLYLESKYWPLEKQDLRAEGFAGYEGENTTARALIFFIIAVQLLGYFFAMQSKALLAKLSIRRILVRTQKLELIIQDKTKRSD